MSNDVNPYDIAGVRKAMEEFRDHIEQAEEKTRERGGPAAAPAPAAPLSRWEDLDAINQLAGGA